MNKEPAVKSEQHKKNGIVVTERKKTEGTDYPVHWHDYYELQIITGGSGIHVHNGIKTEYSAGSAWILSYCDYHGFDYKTDTFSISICFDEDMVSPELIPFVSTGMDKCNCKFNPNELDEIKALAKRLKAELSSKKLLRNTMVSSLLTDILVRIIRSSHINPADAMPSYVQKVVAYVYKNFRHETSLHKIAAELSVSVNYLGALFTRSMGMHFNTYLNMVRLRYCCNLLLGTDLSVKEIAYSGGYSSVEYFIQVFKSTLGITPSKYRNSAKNATDI